MRVGILTSGGLGYKVVSDLIEKIPKPIFLATDKNSQSVIDFASEKNIKIFVGNPRDGKLINYIRENSFELDLVISVSYLFLLDKALVDFLPVAINVHGSLLPLYRGRTPHVWSIINGESITGVTAHIIDEGCDTGEIVKQEEVLIDQNDTGEKILKKFEKIYPEILISIINELKEGGLKGEPQDDTKATYFGKRTPDDGLINWSWQKKRIRNWVRAQSYPYPGAFSFIHGEKLIIDEVKLSDLGFSDTIADGTILKAEENPIIKCPNGALELTKIRNKEILKDIKPNMVLNQ